MYRKFIYAIILSCFIADGTLSYKILMICPMPTRSHYNLCKGVLDILHDAKHDVTFITSLPSEKPKYREINVTLETSPNDEDAKSINKFEIMTNGSKFNLISKLSTIIKGLIESTYKSESVQNLLQDEKEKFDLVIVEYFFNQGFAGFGVKYDCPVIMLSAVAPRHWLARFTGNPISPATVPNGYLTFSNNMDFTQRIINTGIAVVQEILGYVLVDRFQQQCYEKYLPNEAARVPFSKLHEKVALTFSNSHPSIGYARPFLPNVVEIGGYHISENTTLPEEYKKLLDGAKDGVIFFSMGSNLKSADMPRQLKIDILKALSKRKETVLWKYEEDLPNKPKNVIIRSWMPQSSILVHPNVKVFISHGGLLSTTEAASAGVPVLSIPIYGDQFTNAKTTEHRGCGLVLEFLNLTEESLTWALEELIANPKYAETAVKTHQLFHDRPMKPKNLVLFYTEHVIRTGGAQHLSASYLPLYASLLLDVIAVLLLLPLILIITTVWACKKCFEMPSSKSISKRKLKTH